ncbi:MAG: hypothetical protein DMG36_04180 [Acidobacteria bacterium]|nr:MAG: hypothetical protein DMG36_04180 [Acidobacteriota bacterium]
MQHFTKLLVWKRSHQPVLAIYGASVGFPRAELFGLTSQLRRAALSPAASRYLKEVSEILRMLSGLRTTITRGS